ncbi:hypothetical protein DICA2_C16534 [Diutina catenulata]
MARSTRSGRKPLAPINIPGPLVDDARQEAARAHETLVQAKAKRVKFANRKKVELSPPSSSSENERPQEVDPQIAVKLAELSDFFGEMATKYPDLGVAKSAATVKAMTGRGPEYFVKYKLWVSVLEWMDRDV